MMLSIRFIQFFWLLLLFICYLFGNYRLTLRKKYGYTVEFVVYAFIFLLISLLVTYFRGYVLSLIPSIIIYAMVSETGQGYPLPALPVPSSGNESEVDKWFNWEGPSTSTEVQQPLRSPQATTGTSSHHAPVPAPEAAAGPSGVIPQNEEVTQDHLWEELEDEENKKKFARENKQLNKDTDKLIAVYQEFKNRALDLACFSPTIPGSAF